MLPILTFDEILMVESSLTLLKLHMWVDGGFLGLAAVLTESRDHSITSAYGSDLTWATTKFSEVRSRISFVRQQEFSLSLDGKSYLLNDFHEHLIDQAIAFKFKFKF